MSPNPKQPKQLDITSPPVQKKSGGDDQDNALPVSVELSKIRDLYHQNFETALRSKRASLIKSIQDERKSKVFVFYSRDMLAERNARTFIECLQQIGKQTKLDLFLLSPGGFADQAFKMSRWCRQYAEEFNVIIPYYAKSAATLLALGSDELLMGPSSELGPIDPQIPIPDEYGRLRYVSALSIKEALEAIENLTEGDQDKMLKYMPLIEKIDLNILGDYVRVIESSKQYASQLLKGGQLLGNKTECENVAHALTEGYYSHGYAIGVDEARNLGFNVLSPGDNGFSDGLWESVWRLHKMYEDMMDNSRTERRISQNMVEHRQLVSIMETDSFSAPGEEQSVQDLSQS